MSDQSLREHLVYLLKGGGAHLSFESAFTDWPVSLRGVTVPGCPHTAWRLLEHLRICQWDILEFSRNAEHVSPEFPDGYWPSENAPPEPDSWERSIRAFQTDLQQMIELVENPQTNLYAKIPHGDGQTILREALLVADHNAYHLGQVTVLRKCLDAGQSA